MKLQFDEVRRLTGPSILWQRAGAVVDVLCDDVDQGKVGQVWHKWSSELLAAIGWEHETSVSRFFSGGASFAISAPLDALYTACDLAELIWACCEAELMGGPPPNIDAVLPSIKASLREESNPRLLQIIDSAAQHQVLVLSDDDELSLGAGAAVKTWPLCELPDPQSLDWPSFHAIPIALITGTNGKSTSVRLAAEMAKAAGKMAGVTSTDFVKVGDDVIEHGDYSGPGGARLLLRDPRTEIAFLEVARGGILRRGLPIEQAQAALITNVASDHLGQYGIDTVEELAEVKFVVAKALSPSGVLVLNADNDLVVEQAKKLDQMLCWFSLDNQHPLVQQQINSGGRAVTLRDSIIHLYDREGEHAVLALDRIPMTFNGFAKHNVKNALGVVGLCAALGLPLTAIREGLQNFASDPSDNPGRGNQYDVAGANVIVDFAHNGHGMRAVAKMAKAMPANRRIVMFGHAGDRSDDDIADLTNAVMEMQADYYIVTEYEHYLRGRALGDIPKLVRSILEGNGVTLAQITVAPDPVTGTQLALDMASPGDTLLLFVLDQRDQVHQLLQQST